MRNVEAEAFPTMPVDQCCVRLLTASPLASEFREIVLKVSASSVSLSWKVLSLCEDRGLAVDLFHACTHTPSS